VEDKDKIPEHLTFVRVEVHEGIWGCGRVYHNNDHYKTVTVSGVTQDENGDWFEYTVQLNHPHIVHKWELLQAGTPKFSDTHLGYNAVAKQQATTVDEYLKGFEAGRADAYDEINTPTVDIEQLAKNVYPLTEEMIKNNYYPDEPTYRDIIDWQREAFIRGYQQGVKQVQSINNKES